MLFDTPIKLCHALLRPKLKGQIFALDATCGNGHDSHFLASHLRLDTNNKLYLIDIQQLAIDETMSRLREAQLGTCVEAFCCCHSELEGLNLPPLDIIVYNLGYLPKSDKKVITKASTTLKSLNVSIELLKPTGLLSITCYPGHEGGFCESEEILKWAKGLDKAGYNCMIHKWLNRSSEAPFLILIEKK